MSLRDHRLQRVRRVRRVQEQVALADWSNAQALAVRATHDQQQADAERQRALQGLQEAQGAQRNVPQEILLLQRCLDLLSVRRDKLVEAETAAHKRAEEALGRWSESKRALAALERLEARAQIRSRAERECKEMRELDAVASERSAAGRRNLETDDGPISSQSALAEAGKRPTSDLHITPDLA